MLSTHFIKKRKTVHGDNTTIGVSARAIILFRNNGPRWVCCNYNRNAFSFEQSAIRLTLGHFFLCTKVGSASKSGSKLCKKKRASAHGGRLPAVFETVDDSHGMVVGKEDCGGECIWKAMILTKYE